MSTVVGLVFWTLLVGRVRPRNAHELIIITTKNFKGEDESRIKMSFFYKGTDRKPPVLIPFPADRTLNNPKHVPFHHCLELNMFIVLIVLVNFFCLKAVFFLE